MNEERNDDENDEKEEAKEEETIEENKAQAKEIKFDESKKSRTQKINEKIVDERRMFTIFKSFVLRESSIERASRINDK